MKLIKGKVKSEVTGSSVAHDAPSTANPILGGFVAEATTPAAVADGDLSQAAGTLYGATFVNPVTSAGAQTTGATGAAVPAGAIMAGGTDGTNLRAFSTDAGGRQNVVIKTAAGSDLIANLSADGRSLTQNAFPVQAAMHLSNGVTLDAMRGNTVGTPLAYAARTATADSSQLTLYNGLGITCAIYVGAKVGATTLELQLQMFVPATGIYITLATSGALGVVAINAYAVVFAPGVLDADYAVVAAKSVRVPRQYRLRVVPSDTDSVTYEVDQFEHAV